MVVKWHVKLCGLFSAEVILVEEQPGVGIRRFIAFPRVVI